MWTIDKQERLQCPDEFQQRVIDAGGYNRYGQPNFRIVWSQTRTDRRAGLNGEYEDYLPYFTQPCWVLEQWHGPEQYGTPDSWYILNVDEATGLCLLGEYPYEGRYECVMAFRWKGIVNGQLRLEYMPLNQMIIDIIIPIIIQAQEVAFDKKKTAVMELEEREKQQDIEAITDRLQNATPLFKDAASYAGMKSTQTVVQQKMRIIEQNCNRAMGFLQRHGHGISTSQ